MFKLPVWAAALPNSAPVTIDATLRYHAPTGYCQPHRKATVTLVRAIVYGVPCDQCASSVKPDHRSTTAATTVTAPDRRPATSIEVVKEEPTHWVRLAAAGKRTWCVCGWQSDKHATTEAAWNDGTAHMEAAK